MAFDVLPEMKLIHDQNETAEFQFSVEPFSAAAKAAVDAIRRWPRQSDLVEFAVKRHGYGNTDGYFGIIYPGDLDDCDQVSGESIPEGSVKAYAWYGETDGDTHVLSELEYLDFLRQYFEACGLLDLATSVETLHNEIATSADDTPTSPSVFDG
jgi:hypothetical protein